MILEATSFKATVVAAKDSLNEIARMVEKYGNHEEAETFLAACGRQDYREANRLLDKTIERITGITSALRALSVFADKYSDQIPELGRELSSAYSEKNKIRVINNYAAQIRDIMGRG